jgi:uridylate kinase
MPLFQKQLPKRILLKISGEMLSSKQQNFTLSSLEHIGASIKATKAEGIHEIAIVIGGGNLFRGRDAETLKITPHIADRVGMLATCMNALVLQDFLEQAGLEALVMGDFLLHPNISPFHLIHAKKALSAHQIVIFANGLAQPFFTTDTAAVVRAQEINADLIMKATKVPGVYDKDPCLHKDAKRYTTLTYAEALEKKIGVMDDTAFCLLQKAHLPLFVFQFGRPLSLCKALLQPNCGTWVTS